MPSVTINIAGRGTPTSDGKASTVGHMWYSLTDNNGNTSSFGFSPDLDHQGQPFAPGDINAHGADDSYYLGRDYTKTIELSQEQYDAMKAFGEDPAAYGFDTYYKGSSNSCIDFTWKALAEAGLNPSGYQGNLWPTVNGLSVSELLDRSKVLWGDLNTQLTTRYPNGIAWGVNSSFLSGRSAILRRDPLALDLDGDGLETVGIGTNPILFDHDGDSVKTGTGWLKGDDAFLALDRNGNGSIDNGGELFGVDTVLSNGQKAAHGFAALADLDSNCDGKFSNLDAQYANVKVWRDLNQDGISQSNELSTLAAAGIASINVTSTATNIALGNGNVQSAAGSYTKTNGQTGTVGEFTTGGSGNLDLAQNAFYSEFTVRIPLTDAARALPGMEGSGMVRDLQEAASLNAALVADVNSFSSMTRSQMLSAIDTLLADWAGTSTMKTSIADAQSRGYGRVDYGADVLLHRQLQTRRREVR